MQHVGKSDPVQHLIADSIDHAERDIGNILGRIDVHAERPFAEGRIHYLDNGVRNAASASAGTMAENAFMICSPKPA